MARYVHFGTDPIDEVGNGRRGAGKDGNNGADRAMKTGGDDSKVAQGYQAINFILRVGEDERERVRNQGARVGSDEGRHVAKRHHNNATVNEMSTVLFSIWAGL